jgi:2-amino-4-hydroxy-6-hydroxymethyldihydropteridine diphosphokinase
MWARAFVLVPLADVAPGLVGAADLQSLAWQGIERVEACLGLPPL